MRLRREHVRGKWAATATESGRLRDRHHATMSEAPGPESRTLGVIRGGGTKGYDTYDGAGPAIVSAFREVVGADSADRALPWAAHGYGKLRETTTDGEWKPWICVTLECGAMQQSVNVSRNGTDWRVTLPEKPRVSRLRHGNMWERSMFSYDLRGSVSVANLHTGLAAFIADDPTRRGGTVASWNLDGEVKNRGTRSPEITVTAGGDKGHLFHEGTWVCSAADATLKRVKVSEFLNKTKGSIVVYCSNAGDVNAPSGSAAADPATATAPPGATASGVLDPDPVKPESVIGKQDPVSEGVPEGGPSTAPTGESPPTDDDDVPILRAAARHTAAMATGGDVSPPPPPALSAPVSYVAVRQRVSLTNLGNTCFMNSALQLVDSVPEARDLFVQAALDCGRPVGLAIAAVMEMLGGNVPMPVCRLGALVRALHKHKPRIYPILAWGEEPAFANMGCTAEVVSEILEATTAPEFPELQDQSSPARQLRSLISVRVKYKLRCTSCMEDHSHDEEETMLHVPLPSVTDRSKPQVFDAAAVVNAYKPTNRLVKCEASGRNELHEVLDVVVTPSRLMFIDMRRQSVLPC